MSAEMLAVIVTAVGVLVTVFQWYFSLRAARRQRDIEMVLWAGQVIDLMAELESACYPLTNAPPPPPAEVEALSVRASALVDRGRLFFRNVVPKRSKDGDEGLRVKVLDKVLGTHYIARFLASNEDADRLLLRRHVWQARGEFVRLIQREMGPSLKHPGEDSAGEHIPIDPRRWPAPTRSLRLG